MTLFPFILREILSFVAVCSSEIAGAVMCGHDGRRGYLNHLGVSPRYRRKGIAKQLLSNVEKGLTKVGIKKEALFVLWTIHLRRNFTSIWAGMKKQL